MPALAIADGTTRHTALAAGRFRVSDVSFAPGCRLARHAHPHGCVAVVVEGTVRKDFDRDGTDAAAGTLVAMPPEEPHADRFGREGARIVVVEAREGVDAVAWFRDWEATLVSLRIARELAAPDAFTALAVEGLGLELAALASRHVAATRAPAWLEPARELLHERFVELPSAEEIARCVGVDPAELARSFRAHFGETLGGYARRLRLEWAAERLVRSDDPLACLAYDAGFVDQSHFTRAFKQHFGLPPGRYRDAHR